jgi:hypothetical protein
MNMATELPPMKKKDMDELRDFLGNGTPEWLVLLAAVKNHGTVTNAKIIEEIGHDPTWNMSYARMSQAKKRLEKKGILCGIPSYRGVSHNVELGMEEELAHLFQAALAIIRRKNEIALYKASNAIKRDNMRREK